MGLTPAERQRRSRAHRKGDHALCDRARCDAVTPAVTDVTSDNVTSQAAAPADLQVRGRWLWHRMHDGEPPRPEHEVLIAEACRITDRLDRLDALLTGDEDTWARLQMPDTDGGEVRLVVNAALSEARQQALALKAIAAELRAARAGAKPAGKEGSVLDQLAARRAARRANTAG